MPERTETRLQSHYKTSESMKLKSLHFVNAPKQRQYISFLRRGGEMRRGVERKRHWSMSFMSVPRRTRGKRRTCVACVIWCEGDMVLGLGCLRNKVVTAAAATAATEGRISRKDS